MDAAVFLACSSWAMPSCCRILPNYFQQSNDSPQVYFRALEEKVVFLRLIVLFFVR